MPPKRGGGAFPKLAEATAVTEEESGQRRRRRRCQKNQNYSETPVAISRWCSEQQQTRGIVSTAAFAFAFKMDGKLACLVSKKPLTPFLASCPTAWNDGVTPVKKPLHLLCLS